MQIWMFDLLHLWVLKTTRDPLTSCCVFTAVTHLPICEIMFKFISYRQQGHNDPSSNKVTLLVGLKNHFYWVLLAICIEKTGISLGTSGPCVLHMPTSCTWVKQNTQVSHCPGFSCCFTSHPAVTGFVSPQIGRRSVGNRSWFSK